MDWRTSTTSSGRLAGVTIIVAVIAAMSGNTAMAQSSNSASQAGLVGTWTVQVTLRDCQTNAPLGPPFRSLATFHRGGTASGSTSSLAFAIGQRSQEHTTWAHVGEGVYVQQIAALIVFDTPPNLPGPGFNPALPISPGFLAGLQTVTHTIELPTRTNGALPARMPFTTLPDSCRELDVQRRSPNVFELAAARLGIRATAALAAARLLLARQSTIPEVDERA